MPDPINSISYRDLWADQPADREDFRETIARRADDATYGVCREPTTVIGAALCDDPTAVSNACRRAKPGTIDDVLCDDVALHKAQKTALDVAKWAAEKVVDFLLGARLSKP
jgi:hypothetical protein